MAYVQLAYEFFTAKELMCKCQRKHTTGMNPEFMTKLVALRKHLKFSIPISSAYRCPLHNQEVSNTGPDGPHTTGRAIDASVYGPKAFELVVSAFNFRFTGIGVSQKGSVDARFIHLDDLTEMPHPRPWVWSY